MANISKVELNGTTYNIKTSGSIPTSEKGAANGVASLDSTGKVPSSQLPSYVDDVLEYSAKSSFPTTGETGKIYVDTSTNKTYRWSGSAYVEISESLALGETSSTAYRGDRGKAAYDHSQTTSGNPHNVTKSDVGLGNVGNFKAVSTVASQGLSNTEKSNARANIGAGTGNGTYSKPSGGIPKSDLATAVQTSLNQVATNQTNILYGLEKIGTNLIKPRDDLPTVVTALPEGLRVQRSNTTSSFAYVKCGTVYLESGKKYALYDATYAPTTKHHYFYVDCGGNGFIELSTPSLTATVQYGTGRTTGTYDIYTRIDANSTVDTISTPIICLESVWKQLEAYTPYGAPNYDLTRLEAEDRAGLVECVDGGAKNKFDINDVYYNKSGVDYSVNDNTGTYIASTTSITYSRTMWNLSLKANVAYKLSFDVTAISTTDKIRVFPTKSSTAQSATWGQLDITQTGHYELEFTPTAEQIWLTVYLNITDTARIVSCTITNLMICTKAASGVSSKFVPYRLNYDLVCQNIKDVNTVLEAVL